MKRDSVAIRSVSRSNFLHGTLYLTGSDGVVSNAAVSNSNFTKSGLGGIGRSNLEINLALNDTTILAELREWFDLLWKNPQRTEHVKQKVLDALARVVATLNRISRNW